MDAEIPLPLIVTGIAGVAGYNAFRYFRARFPGQVYGVRREDNWPLSGDGILGCNSDDFDRWQEIIDQIQPAAVLNCEGSCALKSCELDPQMAERINVTSVENLLRVIAPTTRFIHLSIDLVFSGDKEGGYTEEDTPDPVTVYGKTMVAAERLVLERRPDACILRISLPMGISFNGHAGAIDWIQSRFKNGRPATLYFDEVRTPTYTDCLILVLERLLGNDLAGLYHCGGPRNLSLYQIAQIVNRVGGYDPKLLMGCPRIDAGPMPPRAGNVTMDSSRLIAALGDEVFHPWPLDCSMVPSDIDWHHDRSTLQGSPELLADVLYRNPRRVASMPELESIDSPLNSR
ncbi:dTDP-4-dehydrorhamnose reductase [Rosistilla carotiformis]|uniref:dTDP-4-dehydrorhamnose reductase n=1 Tax=Rosistilla carotiformis TaxID=2528017 RepID=A0A518JVV2_9BACT|nr:sugar nucleotide-binding protein [Rosistilla carotiformis]QDV69670.1 dTDP-4-dehydrorhamnose reductase [Rosistilla carotiformis]